LKMISADRTLAFEIGKNSEIKARRTEPAMGFEKDLQMPPKPNGIKGRVYGSVQRSLISSDSFPISKASVLSAYPWFFKGLDC
jgi:hypothetical protein